MRTKEELKAELEAIEQKEYEEFIETNYPKFKELVGRCFKLKNNYSCPEKKSDYWYKYTKITSIEKDDVYRSCGGEALSYYHGISFQTDKNGRIDINPMEESYVHSLGNEITLKEFNRALDIVKLKINSL